MRRKKVEASDPGRVSQQPEVADTDPEPRAVDKVPQLPIAWGNIVVDTLRIADPAGLARRLRDELTLGDDRTNYGRVLEALDRSAHNLDAAGRLYRSAVIEEQRYESQTAERLEVLRSTAKEDLQAEYQKKLRKSPTKEDVEDRIVANWPDEYRTTKLRRAELHGAVRSLEILKDAWSARCAALRTMADKTRPTF